MLMEVLQLTTQRVPTPAELLSKMDSLLMLARQWSLYADRELWMAIVRRTSDVVHDIGRMQLAPELTAEIKERSDAIREAFGQRIAEEYTSSSDW